MRVALVCFFVVIFAMALAWDGERSYLVIQYKKALARSDAKPNEVRLAKSILTEVARLSGENRKINVNGKFDENAINVALAPSHGNGNADSAVQDFSIYAAPPNLLIVDLNTFRDILLMAINETGYFDQWLTSGMPDNPTLGAISSQLRLENLTHRGDVDVRLGSLVADALVEAGDARQRKSFGLPFLFIFAHEIYHLKHSKGSLAIDEEERKADDFALGVIRNYEKNLQGTKGFSPIDRQLLFIGVRYLQDRILEEVFHNFRGLDADSLFTALYHADCLSAGRVPWPMRFNNPDVVTNAEYRPLPVLSDDEVRGVVQALNEFAETGHDHLLERIIRITGDIQTDPILDPSIDIVFQKSHNLLEIYRSRRASLGMFLEGYLLPAPGDLSIYEVMSLLHAKPRAVSARGCDSGKCIVAEARGGTLSSINEDGMIQVMQLVLPPTRYSLEAINMVLEYVLDKKQAKSTLDKLQRNYNSCRVASALIERSPYIIKIRTMNEDGWMELVMGSQIQPENFQDANMN